MAHGKRSRQQQAETTSVSLMDLDGGDMARILMLFSGHHNSHGHQGAAAPASPERVFECKTCSRRFPSFQALGGHMRRHRAVAAAGAGVERGLSLDLDLGPRGDGKKKTTAVAAGLMIDLNVPALALEEEEPADHAKLGLAVEMQFPVVVDFRR
ncbi:unnamed protein product [Triticum turgidum subsp. durum]|uniref:C2H2-type domain-containing protein n=1 Tax=Triticum turgidum subsp. durum TaxID=4567 RepID=A0A9R0S702_TRITD|nr:unnamed protein product [Triticum turgidum subsp. durum]